MTLYTPNCTDTAAQDGAMAACVGGSLSSPTPVTSQADDAGTLGSSEKVATVNQGVANQRFAMIQSAPNQPNDTSWESGDWVVRFEVTTALMSLTWENTHICRVNSSGVSQGTVGTGATGSIQLTNGVKTHTLSGVAADVAAALDEIYIVILGDGPGGMSTSTVGITFSQVLDTPIDDAAPVEHHEYARRMEHSIAPNPSIRR